MAGRRGKMIALGFSSSNGSRAYEQDFKKIDFGGAYGFLRNEVTKNIKSARLQILPYTTGGPAEKTEAAKRDGLSMLGDD